MSDIWKFQTIGIARTCFKERFGTPRQPGLTPSSWCKIELDRRLNLEPALEGLKGFSHLWVVYVFHQNTNKKFHAKVHPPRLNGESMGVFATRSPHRPNPIGLSVAKIERVEGRVIELSGVDILDGSPVLDLKPYLPATDSIPHALPGWTDSVETKALQVSFSERSLKALVLRVPEVQRSQVQQLIEEILQADPRPHFYKGSESQPNPYMTTYGFRLEDWNVVFEVHGSSALVVDVEDWADAKNKTNQVEAGTGQSPRGLN